MRTLLINGTIIFLVGMMISCKPSENTDQQENWIQLFNGKDLADWDIKITGHPLGENYMNTFRVKNGKLIVSYDQYDEFKEEFGHIFYRRPFSYYRLRVEYRITGEQVPGGPDWAFKNNGVMLHSQSPETMLQDQAFPVCVEAQFLGGAEKGERPTANLCTPGTHVVMNGELITHHCINSSSKTYRGREWVSVELVVLGDSIIHHIVEGDTVLTYNNPQIGGDLPEGFPLLEGTLLSGGYIALQAESHPFEFRKVELLDLSGIHE